MLEVVVIAGGNGSALRGKCLLVCLFMFVVVLI